MRTLVPHICPLLGLAGLASALAFATPSFAATKAGNTKLHTVKKPKLKAKTKTTAQLSRAAASKGSKAHAPAVAHRTLPKAPAPVAAAPDPAVLSLERF